MPLASKEKSAGMACSDKDAHTLFQGNPNCREIGKCFPTTFSSLHLVSTLNVGK